MIDRRRQRRCCYLRVGAPCRDDCTSIDRVWGIPRLAAVCLALRGTVLPPGSLGAETAWTYNRINPHTLHIRCHDPTVTSSRVTRRDYRRFTHLWGTDGLPDRLWRRAGN